MSRRRDDGSWPRMRGRPRAARLKKEEVVAPRDSESHCPVCGRHVVWATPRMECCGARWAYCPEAAPYLEAARLNRRRRWAVVPDDSLVKLPVEGRRNWHWAAKVAGACWDPAVGWSLIEDDRVVSYVAMRT